MDTDKTLTFAVASSSSSAEAHLGALCDELSRALSLPVSPRVLPSYAAVKEEIESGRAQIAWAPPLVAFELVTAGLASIDLCCARGGQVDYHAALFTQHTSRIEKLADLEGSHVAWVDANSSAGYLFPRMRLASEGLDPDKLFGRESFLGSHALVARAVLEGEADAGATYLSLDPRSGRPMSAGWLDAGAGINGAFILATAGPIPSDAIVVSSRTPEEVRASIVQHITALPRSMPEAVGQLFNADGFAPPRESHIEALRALSTARKKAS